MSEESKPSKSSKPKPTKPFSWKKMVLLVVVVALIAVAYTQFRDSLSLENLAQQESKLRAFQQESPWLVYGAAFLLYVLVTALSLPGAAVMTLVYGWYFGLGPGIVLVSFASTTGATLAFLLSRYLFRDAIMARFGDRLEKIDAALDREGPFYLFALRLIPAVPFFILNAVMGLTRINVWTYWWISQLGMLAATCVFVYAGSSVPDLQTLADNGIKSVFTPQQLTKITIAFALLGLFPIVTRWMMKRGTGLTKPEGDEAIPG